MRKIGPRDTKEFPGRTDAKVKICLQMAGRPGGSVGNLGTLNLLTLGREFESRCRHTDWDFSSQKKKKKKMANKWRKIKSLAHKFDFTVDEGKKGTAESFSR